MIRSLAIPLLFGLLISTASAVDQPVVTTLTLTSPSDYQVVQRRTQSSGKIVVEGSVNIPPKSAASRPDRLQARLSGKSLPDQWQVLPYDARVPKFRGEVEVPVGGWYRLDVRLLSGEQTVAEAVVEHVGMGEVFVGSDWKRTSPSPVRNVQAALLNLPRSSPIIVRIAVGSFPKDSIRRTHTNQSVARPQAKQQTHGLHEFFRPPVACSLDTGPADETFSTAHIARDSRDLRL